MQTLELPARRTSAGAARRFVERIVRRLGLDAATERDAALLTSELATNALFHAETPFRVGVDVDDERVRVEVLDRSGHAPEPRTPTDDDIGGRGLRIVESVAARWGHAAHPEGKVVWFELPVDGRRGSGAGETLRV